MRKGSDVWRALLPRVANVQQSVLLSKAIPPEHRASRRLKNVLENLLHKGFLTWNLFVKHVRLAELGR